MEALNKSTPGCRKEKSRCLIEIRRSGFLGQFFFVQKIVLLADRTEQIQHIVGKFVGFAGEGILG